MPRVVTFGEIMARLATPGHLMLAQTGTLDLTFGGGEANVAVSLAQLGISAAFVTRLPKNDLADACLSRLRGLGVDVGHVVRGGGRMGIYFLETGAAQRPSTVLYDRAHSAIAEINPADIAWPTVLEGADWFHFTGITPALSDSAAAACADAARTARQMGMTVSCDLNFRKKLWSAQKAQQVMTGLMEHVDVCMANEEDAQNVFGITATGSDVSKAKVAGDAYTEVAAEMTRRFGFRAAGISLRESLSANRNGWSAMLYTNDQSFFSRRYEIDIVDRVGSGDAFAAGLIYAMLNSDPPQQAIEFAAAAGCLKHSIVGDFNLVGLAQIQTLLRGDGSGRVQR